VLDPGTPSAHVALGSVYRNRHEWERSEAAYLRALQLDPDNAEAHQQYSEMLTTLGRIDEGRRAAERALALDRNPVRLLQLANTLGPDGYVDEALEALQEGVALDRDRRTIGLYNGWPYWAMEAGRYDEMFDKGADVAFEREPTRAEQAVMVAALHAGEISAYPRDLLDPAAWMIFGQPDSAAVAMLGEFEEFPYQNWNWIWEPIFDPLRDQPAYRELTRRLGIEARTAERSPR
jgi:tetratricopeptide (TPR) repeat protein